jgi:hypothetical protein
MRWWDTPASCGLSHRTRSSQPSARPPARHDTHDTHDTHAVEHYMRKRTRARVSYGRGVDVLRQVASPASGAVHATRWHAQPARVAVTPLSPVLRRNTGTVSARHTTHDTRHTRHDTHLGCALAARVAVQVVAAHVAVAGRAQAIALGFGQDERVRGDVGEDAHRRERELVAAPAPRPPLPRLRRRRPVEQRMVVVPHLQALPHISTARHARRDATRHGTHGTRA